MTTHSLILSPHEVRAALDGRLGLVVRPVAKDFANSMDPPRGPEDVAAGYPYVEDEYGDAHKAVDLCPLGVPGDRLCCRESWKVEELEDGLDGVRFKMDGSFIPIENTIEASDKWGKAYSNGKHGEKWRSPATMPVWASRITLEVVGVRCVRVQELTEEDAIAGGVRNVAIGQYLAISRGTRRDTARSAFRDMWDTTHGGVKVKDLFLLERPVSSMGTGWNSNPWVWATEVRRVEG